MLGHWYIQLLAGAAPAAAAPPAAVGVPGGGRYVIYIDGEPYIGTMQEVQAVLQSLAEQEAKQVIEKAKQPRKPVIKVEPGKDLPKPFEFKPEPVRIQVQEIYQEAYDAAFGVLMAIRLAEIAREIDEEEAMLLL